MSKYTVIAGLDGTGKSSLRGILEGEACFLGKIIDADFIAKANNFNTLKAGKQALSEIKTCRCVALFVLILSFIKTKRACIMCKPFLFYLCY